MIVAQERRAIQAALRREVARRREQLQAQAAEERGPAAAKEVTWDTAFTQVMLAQQQTIAQLLELVNAARAELAEEVSAHSSVLSLCTVGRAAG